MAFWSCGKIFLSCCPLIIEAAHFFAHIFSHLVGSIIVLSFLKLVLLRQKARAALVWALLAARVADPVCSGVGAVLHPRSPLAAVLMGTPAAVPGTAAKHGSSQIDGVHAPRGVAGGFLVEQRWSVARSGSEKVVTLVI